MVATHEAGHFLVSIFCPHHPPPEKVTIQSDMPWAPFFTQFKHEKNADRHEPQRMLDMLTRALRRHRGRAAAARRRLHRGERHSATRGPTCRGRRCSREYIVEVLRHEQPRRPAAVLPRPQGRPRGAVRLAWPRRSTGR